MNKTTLMGFFVVGLPDTYKLQVKNNRASIFEDAIEPMMTWCHLRNAKITPRQARKIKGDIPFLLAQRIRSLQIRTRNLRRMRWQRKHDFRGFFGWSVGGVVSSANQQGILRPNVPRNWTNRSRGHNTSSRPLTDLSGISVNVLHRPLTCLNCNFNS